MPTKTGNSYLICDQGANDLGKTTSLVAVAKSLCTNSAYRLIHMNTRLKTECFMVFEEITTGKTILINSRGDDAKAYRDVFKYLAMYKVDIAILACRPHGVTLKEVKRIAALYGYTELFYTNVHPKNKNSWQPSFSTIISSANTDLLLNLISNL